MIAKAFPCKGYIKNEDNTIGEFNYAGMDLRDYFAAKALAGMSANPNDDHNPFEHEYEEYVKGIAECSYMLADAMMEARKK